MPTFGNLTFTTNAFRITRQAFPYAGVASLAGMFGGDSNWTANTQVATILTRLEQKIMADNPGFGLSYTDVAIAAEDNSIALPSSAYGMAVTQLYWVNEDQVGNLVPIQVISREEGETRSSYQLNDMIVRVPTFAYPSRDGASIIFNGKVSEAAEIRVEYRIKPRAYVAADIDSTAGTNYSNLPDQHIDVLVYRLAAELAEVLADDDRVSRMMAKAEMAQEAFHATIVEMTSGAHRQQFHTFGFPPASLTSQAGYPLQTLNANQSY